MKKKELFFAVLVCAVLLLVTDLVGSAQARNKLVKVGGMKNNCDCTYRIE